jgi:Rieske Fe-S protein
MTASPSPCTGCSARRDFLRSAFTATASIAALSALGPAEAIAALASRSAGGAVRYALPAADGVSIDSTNEVILCRAKDEIFAFALSCPHQNTALKAMPKNAGFQCTRHKSKYLPNGTFVSGRATRNMDRLQITRDGAQIVVNPDIAFESDVDPAKWSAAVITL